MKKILVFILFVVCSIGLISCASESSFESKEEAPAANKSGGSEDNTQYSPEKPKSDDKDAPDEGDKMDDDGKSDADKTGTGGKSDADK